MDDKMRQKRYDDVVTGKYTPLKRPTTDAAGVDAAVGKDGEEGKTGLPVVTATVSITSSRLAGKAK